MDNSVNVAAVAVLLLMAVSIVTYLVNNIRVAQAVARTVDVERDYLRGRVADDETFTRAAAIAAEHCHPAADQRGPEDFKRHLVAELTARALRRAADRASA